MKHQRFRAVAALLMHLFAALFFAESVRAGDEVDYSAPYLTVENGELVTRYPGNEHSNSLPTSASPADEVQERRELQAWQLALVLFLAAIVAGAVLLIHRRRRQRAE